MTPPDPSPVLELSERLVDAQADLHPLWATQHGLPGHDDRLPDLGPDGHRSRYELAATTLAELASLEDRDADDRLLRALMTERLGAQVASYEAGLWRHELDPINSPVVQLREAAELADVTTPAGRRDLRGRYEAFPATLEGYRRSLEAGIEGGRPAAVRQATAVAEQVRSTADHLVGLVRATDDAPLIVAAEQAAAAYAGLGDWLDAEYAPRARSTDACGPDEYRLHQRQFLGADPDPAASYAWGWEQIHRLRAAMAEVAEEILPGAGLDGTLHHLAHESDFALDGVDAIRTWTQDHVDRMIDVFDGTHVDIPPAARRCEVRVGPEGAATAAHYTGPSLDGERPGIYWQPNLGADRRYPLWDQVTTANHEAVPGHHLQIAFTTLDPRPIGRLRRATWFSGHGEGWALYAEELCHELGLLERPEAVMGWLAAAQLRACRVVIDIGVHCGFAIPDDAPLHPGASWTAEIARDVLGGLTGLSDAEVRSEVDRYLGWPGQAPSYQLGLREWRRLRADAEARLGDRFDRRRFHTEALSLGSVGLDLLVEELPKRL